MNALKRGSGGAMGKGRSAGKVFLAVLLFLSPVVVDGLHAGATQAGTAPSGKEARNPFEGQADAVKEGEKIFDAKCADCHGGDAMGQSGPDLTDNAWIYGGSDAEVFETVANGRKGGMPSWRSELSTNDIWRVIAYVRSLRKK